MKWGKFSKKALDFIKNSNAWLNIAYGSVRSTKTINCSVRWLDYVMTGPEGTLIIVGKTRTSLQRNVLDDLQSICGAGFKWISKTDGLCSIYNRRVYCVGANDERSEEKIRGATFAGAYCDEVSLYPESFFNQLLARCSIAGAQLFCNTNPDSPYHWFNTRYIENVAITNKKVWHFVLDDNLNLDETYKTNLKSAYSGLWYKRMILGLWVMAEGVIYDMFNETHVSGQIPNAVDVECVACDYGTGNPTVFLHMARSNGVIHALDEYYYDSRAVGRQKTDGEYADDLLTFLNGRKMPIVVDPSAASFIAELRKRGLPVERAKNDVLDGIRIVGQRLTQHKYFINQKCKNTIQEKYSYVWDAKAQLKGIDQPLKQNDHASDAERYGVFYLSTATPKITARINY